MVQTVILIFAVLALSQAGNLIRLCETSAISITFYRLLIALVLILPFSFKTIHKMLPRTNSRLLLKVFVMAVAFSSHFLAWISAIQRTKVADAAICFSLSPVFTALGAHFFLREKISRRLLLAIGAGVIGVALVGHGDLSLSPRYLTGDLLSLLAGFLFSIHCLIGKTLRKDVPNLFIMTLVYFFGAVLALPCALLLHAPLADFTLQTKVGFLALAIFPTILGHASLIYLMKHFKAGTVSTATLFEPVGAGIVAYLAFSESLTQWSALGYAFIVAGLIPLFAYNSAGYFSAKVRKNSA